MSVSYVIDNPKDKQQKTSHSLFSQTSLGRLKPPSPSPLLLFPSSRPFFAIQHASPPMGPSPLSTRSACCKSKSTQKHKTTTTKKNKQLCCAPTGGGGFHGRRGVPGRPQGRSGSPRHHHHAAVRVPRRSPPASRPAGPGPKPGDEIFLVPVVIGARVRRSRQGSGGWRWLGRYLRRRCRGAGVISSPCGSWRWRHSWCKVFDFFCRCNLVVPEARFVDACGGPG